jgi:outer membrane protein
VKNIFCLIIIFSITTTFSQVQRVLTLDDAFAIASGESYSIKVAEQTLIGSQKNLEIVKAGLLASVNLEFDLPRYSRTLSSQFNTELGTEQFYQVGYTTIEGKLSISQSILFSNGTISVYGSLFGRDQFSSLAGTTRDYFSDVSISLYQPLFIFNSQKGNLERAEINLEKANRQYTQAEKDLIYNVTAAFFNLYQAKKNVEITEEKVKQTEISYTTAVNKFKAGLIAEVEMLQLEVDLAASRNDLFNIQQQYDEGKNEFKLLIGLNIDEPIDVVTTLDFIPVTVDEKEAIESALKNRPDILNADADISLSKLNIDETDSESSLKAEINANYGINKNDDKFDYIFKNFADTRSVSMTLSIPIWDWGKNARQVEAAEANHNLNLLRYKNTKEQIVKEVRSAIRKLNSVKARIDVLSKSVEVAEKSFNISMERFKSGNITSFDLSQMQLKLTDSKINSLNALIDYKLALADLERKTFRKY